MTSHPLFYLALALLVDFVFGIALGKRLRKARKEQTRRVGR